VHVTALQVIASTNGYTRDARLTAAGHAELARLTGELLDESALDVHALEPVTAERLLCGAFGAAEAR